MKAPDLTKEKVETTTYSIKREDSTNKLLSLKVSVLLVTLLVLLKCVATVSI